MPPANKQKKKRRFRGTGLMKLGGLVAAKCILAWMQHASTRVAVFYDRTVDPAFGVGPPAIYIFWHEYILLPLALRGHCHLSMLLSQHGDADILARIAHHVGFDCVRGSTDRGGAGPCWSWKSSSRDKSSHDHARRPTRTASTACA